MYPNKPINMKGTKAFKGVLQAYETYTECSGKDRLFSKIPVEPNKVIKKKRK